MSYTATKECIRNTYRPALFVYIVPKHKQTIQMWDICIPCPTYVYFWPATRAGIFKQSMGARNRVGIGLSYRPAGLHRLAEFIPWNRLLGSINV